MSSSPLSNFTSLDGLTQLIYQGPSRFVLLSALDVAHRHWSVHLGLAGADGRWWRGRWEKADVLRLAGEKASDRVLEVFAEKVADTIVQGELYVGGWIPGAQKGGADLSLIMGPSTKTPLNMSLVELSPEEAAAQATNTFISIALQAQSHKCQIYPSFDAPIHAVIAHQPPPLKRQRSPAVGHSTAAQQKGKDMARSQASGSSPPVPTSTKSAEQREIEGLRHQLTQAKQAAGASPTKGRTLPQVNPKSINAVAARRPQKGASLANPNKKARVYQELEFEDD